MGSVGWLEIDGDFIYFVLQLLPIKESVFLIVGLCAHTKRERKHGEARKGLSDLSLLLGKSCWVTLCLFRRLTYLEPI